MEFWVEQRLTVFIPPKSIIHPSISPSIDLCLFFIPYIPHLRLPLPVLGAG